MTGNEFPDSASLLPLPDAEPLQPLTSEPAGEAAAPEFSLAPPQNPPPPEAGQNAGAPVLQTSYLDDRPLFRSWSESGYELSPRQLNRMERIPHFGHFMILILVVLCALVAVGLLTRLALHAHLFGISTFPQAADNIRYMLGTQTLLYILTLAVSLAVFPLVWHKSLLAGLHWNAHTAFRFRKRLLVAAFLCFLLAILNGLVLPGPNDAPIDKVFRTPGAAWLLFGFGVTFAPFFEELAFRGFLLPMLCTAFDWVGEMSSGRLPLRPCHNGHPRWSIPAMVISSILTSIPFALMHAEQTAYSMGPFLLLLAVSLVLCWVRINTRSLAASVLVHASYNFMIFSLMFLGTGGFQHLDKM
jgi:hypothetical protein